MKKLVVIMLALLLVLSMAAPAQAITTGKWDLNAGSIHVQDTVQNMLDQETAEELPEDPAEISYQNWIHRWLKWWTRQKE